MWRGRVRVVWVVKITDIERSRNGSGTICFKKIFMNTAQWAIIISTAAGLISLFSAFFTWQGKEEAKRANDTRDIHRKNNIKPMISIYPYNSSFYKAKNESKNDAFEINIYGKLIKDDFSRTTGEEIKILGSIKRIPANSILENQRYINNYKKVKITQFTYQDIDNNKYEELI